MTAAQAWLLACLAAFSFFPLGVGLWLASSVLAVFPRKRVRLLLGAVALAALLLSGWVPGLGFLCRLGDKPTAPISVPEFLTVAYLNLGVVVGLGIVLFGRRRAPRPLPPIQDVDLGLGERCLEIHRSRRPCSPLAFLPGNGVYRVRRRDWEVPVHLDGRPLPPDLEGFRILHLSDLHLGRYLVREYFEAVREEAARLEHDALVLTGDYLARGESPAELAGWLAGVGREGARFGVLGNHDVIDHPPGTVAGALRQAGVTLLGGSTAVIRRGAAAVGIAGLDYQNWWRPFPLAALRDRLPGDAYPVLIAHTPCLFPEALRAGFGLVLCGHTHGGQIRFPGLGALFIPARYGRRYQMGLYGEGEGFLHVHPGLGGPPALRLGCPPELTRITLRAAR